MFRRRVLQGNPQFFDSRWVLENLAISLEIDLWGIEVFWRDFEGVQKWRISELWHFWFAFG